MKRHVFALSSVCSLLLLAACSSGTVQDTLGLSRDAPDEFRVVSRPPLSVPPQFNLRPPAAPGETTVVNAMDKKAESLVLGTPAEENNTNTFTLQPGNADTAVAPVQTQSLQTAGKTEPETNFLERAGAADLNPNIRQALEEDKRNANYTVEEEDSWWDVFSTTPAKKDPLVNAKKESERLKKNEEEGKPVTEGETPEVKTRDTGVLGRILGY